jgi:septum formation protein
MTPIDLYLASASPRRGLLLEQIGVRFERLRIAVDETPAPPETAEEYVIRIALEKAAAGARVPRKCRVSPVLGADTAVVLDGAVMGKPRDRDDAARMLTGLGGRTHEVLSAVALARGDRTDFRLRRSRVRLRTLSPREIDDYWDTGEPVDKAGGYAIQGRAAVFVQHLEGSYSGVMGLPLYETWDLLQSFGVAPQATLQEAP